MRPNFFSGSLTENFLCSTLKRWKQTQVLKLNLWMQIEAEKEQYEPNQVSNQDKSRRLNTNREKERHKAINSQHMYTSREKISREKQRMANM